ncbi:MAG: BirA family biotin operon repressor/biotin-[acetyl-CoA-carboxylase] ligase [Candidatus Endobugula sp.]
MNASLVKLLHLLADGEFHSGSIVGEALGVSRTAVWKHLQKLALMGLSAESVKGKGYRLVGGLEMLSHAKITCGLKTLAAAELSAVDVLLETASTNAVAASHVFSSAAKGYACLAEYQQAGRGRRGRQWVSPFGHNIYLSVVWQFDGGVAQLEGLSLAVGVVVANVLAGFGLSDAQLKWPNDILLQGRKLGGVLLEMSGDPAGVCQVVVGIGLNVRMPADAAIDQPWASIAEQLPNISRNQLAAELLNQLAEMLASFHLKGFSAYRDTWQDLDAYVGRSVVVTSGQRALEGVAAGVCDNGALRLQADGEEHTIHGGEVSLRLAEGVEQGLGDVS